MKDIKRIATLLAVLPMIGKLVGYYAGISTSDTQHYFILTHMLLLLVCVFFALRYQPKNSAFIEDIKQSMKGIGVYSSLNAIFLFVYFKFIDTGYFAERIQGILQATNELPPGKTLEDVAGTYEQFFTPFNWATLSLIAWILAGLLYAIMFVVFHRKVLTKFK